MSTIPCLENGIFSRKTVKPLSSVFNFDKEKKAVSTLVMNGEWFTVSGLRRTGKTTLIRSVCNALDVIPVYVNVWGIREEEKEPIILEMIVQEIRRQLRRYKFSKLIDRVDRLSFLGVSISVKARNQVRLEQVIKELVEKKRVVLILDEIQEMQREVDFFKFLAALHDETAPYLSAVFLGSIISLREMLERSYTKPLHGRLGEEIILSPLRDYEARIMLRKGFEECGVSVDDEFIREASYRLGGLPGWITHFGRIVVLNHYMGKEISLDEVYEKLISDVEKILYDEIARAIAERKKLRNYIKILKYVGEHGEITVAETAELIRKKPNTALIYLNHLIKRGILTKIGRRYAVADPIIREVLSKKEMEREVKVRL